jgi:hypothetical protein
MGEKKKGILEQLRRNKFTQVLDKAIEGTDKFLGPSGKAWLANGLEELRQAVALGNGQVQGGNNPGLWGTITTGEATADRMGDLSLDDLRGYAAKAKGSEKTNDRTQEHDGRDMA